MGKHNKITATIAYPVRQIQFQGQQIRRIEDPVKIYSIGAVAVCLHEKDGIVYAQKLDRHGQPVGKQKSLDNG